MPSIDFIADLSARGLLHQISSEEVKGALSAGGTSAYIGFDPTADSLHVGSLLQIITLMRWQQAGQRPIALVGGATGLIGDPSGKTDERSLLDRDTLERYVAGLDAQIRQFLDPGAGAVIVNNADWLKDVGVLEFLRDIGKHFSVNQMIVRDSVRNRLEEREQGISYTEFSYMLLQAYDFLALHDREGCRVQLGGSDQWGNIVSGVDLVRRLRNTDVYGITIPLVTRSDGKKFGKSEEGNIWLDPKRTSPYRFYQFWLNVNDEEAVRYLKYFTFMSVASIDALAEAHAAQPHQREAQKRLAREVTTLVHGEAGVSRAERATQVLFDKQADYRSFAAEELSDAFEGAPTSELSADQLGTDQANVLELLVAGGVYGSKGQARKELPNRAISVNNQPIDDAARVLAQTDVLPGGFVVLRKGKKTYHLVRVISA